MLQRLDLRHPQPLFDVAATRAGCGWPAGQATTAVPVSCGVVAEVLYAPGDQIAEGAELLRLAG